MREVGGSFGHFFKKMIMLKVFIIRNYAVSHYQKLHSRVNNICVDQQVSMLHRRFSLVYVRRLKKRSKTRVRNTATIYRWKWTTLTAI